MKYLITLLLLISPTLVIAQEVGISLGEETVTIQKSLNIIGFRYEGCNQPGNQKLYIEYYLNGAYKQIVIEGYELYNFYMNEWTDGRAIIDKIESVEGIDLSGVNLTTAENQFVAGLPTEQPVE